MAEPMDVSDRVQCLRRSLALSFSHALQPIVDVERQCVLAHEILVRGARGEGAGFVFGQIDERQVIDFDQWSREQALSLTTRLAIRGLLSFNFSPGSILSGDGEYVVWGVARGELTADERERVWPVAGREEALVAMGEEAEGMKEM